MKVELCRITLIRRHGDRQQIAWDVPCLRFWQNAINYFPIWIWVVSAFRKRARSRGSLTAANWKSSKSAQMQICGFVIPVGQAFHKYYPCESQPILRIVSHFLMWKITKPVLDSSYDFLCFSKCPCRNFSKGAHAEKEPALTQEFARFGLASLAFTVVYHASLRTLPHKRIGHLPHTHHSFHVKMNLRSNVEDARDFSRCTGNGSCGISDHNAIDFSNKWLLFDRILTRQDGKTDVAVHQFDQTRSGFGKILCIWKNSLFNDTTTVVPQVIPATTIATGWPAYEDCFVAKNSSSGAWGPLEAFMLFLPGISAAVNTRRTPGRFCSKYKLRKYAAICTKHAQNLVWIWFGQKCYRCT